MSIDVCVSPKNAGVENKKCDPLKKGLNFRVGVFFDGTLNNKYNTKKGPGFNSSGSYQNDKKGIDQDIGQVIVIVRVIGFLNGLHRN